MSESNPSSQALKPKRAAVHKSARTDVLLAKIVISMSSHAPR
jgi:hypothetical protein